MCKIDTQITFFAESQHPRVVGGGPDLTPAGALHLGGESPGCRWRSTPATFFHPLYLGSGRDLECGDLSPLWLLADLSASQGAFNARSLARSPLSAVIRRRQVACQKRRQVSALQSCLASTSGETPEVTLKTYHPFRMEMSAKCHINWGAGCPPRRNERRGRWLRRFGAGSSTPKRRNRSG